MIEDKLTHAQRIRLECLSQVLNHKHMFFETQPTTADIFAKVAELERWMHKANAGFN